MVASYFTGAALALALSTGVTARALPKAQNAAPFETLQVGVYSGIFPLQNAACTGSDCFATGGAVPTGGAIPPPPAVSAPPASQPGGVFVSIPYVTVTVTAAPATVTITAEPNIVCLPSTAPGFLPVSPATSPAAVPVPNPTDIPVVASGSPQPSVPASLGNDTNPAPTAVVTGR